MTSMVARQVSFLPYPNIRLGLYEIPFRASILLVFLFLSTNIDNLRQKVIRPSNQPSFTMADDISDALDACNNICIIVNGIISLVECLIKCGGETHKAYKRRQRKKALSRGK